MPCAGPGAVEKMGPLPSGVLLKNIGGYTLERRRRRRRAPSAEGARIEAPKGAEMGGVPGEGMSPSSAD